MGILKMEGVTHWSIPVNNLEQSEKFHGDLLGLKPLEFPSSSLPTAPRVTLREGSFISSIQAEQTRAARSDLEARHARARIRRNRAFVSHKDEKNLAWHRSDSLTLPFEAVAPGGGIPSHGERWIYHGNSCGALGGL